MLKPAPQLMGSIPKDPRKKFIVYFNYVGKWLEDLPADQIAEDLHFDSPAQMYQSLNKEGFSVCEKCGETPVKADHSKKHKRKPQGASKAKEVPTAGNAADLFKSLVDALASSVRDLDHRIARYRDGLFEEAEVYRGESVMVPRNLFRSEDEWHAFCETQKRQSDEKSVLLSQVQVANAVGADASPRETALIAAYLLWEEAYDHSPKQKLKALAGKRQKKSTEQKVEELLEALHPLPNEANRQKLLHGNPQNPEQHPGKVEELRRVARQVSRLIRGVSIWGAPKEGFSAEKLNTAWFIQDQLRAGRPYEKIKQELIDKGFEESEVDFLMSLEISPPH